MTLFAKTLCVKVSLTNKKKYNNPEKGQYATYK